MATLLLKSNAAESGTNGAAVTTATSTGATSNGFQTITGTWTFANTPVLSSGLCFSTTGGVSAMTYQSLGTTGQWEVITYWRCTSIATTSTIFRVYQEAANVTYFQFEFSQSANRFRFKNNVTTLGTSTIAPLINTTYKMRAVGNNSTGAVTAYIYDGSGTLLDTIAYTSVAVPKMKYVAFGPNVASGVPSFFDDIQIYDNATYTYTAPANGNAFRVSVGANGTDYPKINSAPTQNLLIGLWSKPYVPTASPLVSGNHEIMCAGGSFWEVQNITDNIAGNTHTDGNINSFNQNTQFFGSKTSGGTLNWANDYTVYYNPGLITQALYLDWKYSMWQVILDTTNSRFIFRQWIKWGLTGAVEKTGESIVTWATIRTALQTNAGWTAGEAAAWVPDNLNHIYLGDSDAGGTLWDYLRNCKVFDRSTEPSLAEVEAYASTFTPDLTAWADWELKWSGGFPILDDRSGNSRTMFDNGTIRQGDYFSGGVTPTPSNTDPYNVYGLDWSGRIF